VAKFSSQGQGLRRSTSNGYENLEPAEARAARFEADALNRSSSMADIESGAPLTSTPIYPFGVARNRLQLAAKHLGVPAVILHALEGAAAMITLKSYFRRRQKAILDAEERGIPIYVLRSNSIVQIEQVLAEIFNLHSFGEQALRSLNTEAINNQTQAAIEAVRNGQRWVDLPPAAPSVRRIQHELARQSDLVSHSYGKEPSRYVRIFRE
jgi:hypothetical protein